MRERNREGKALGPRPVKTQTGVASMICRGGRQEAGEALGLAISLNFTQPSSARIEWYAACICDVSRGAHTTWNARVRASDNGHDLAVQTREERMGTFNAVHTICFVCCRIAEYVYEREMG
jgi:hypothetical protein